MNYCYLMFYETNFPENISIHSKYYIEYNTQINKSKNGREQRISNKDEPLLYYNIISGIKTKDEIESIVKLFKLVKGRAIGFRFKDWLDYSTINQTIGIGDGETTEFQLIKTYTTILNNENITHIRKITKPVKSTVNIFVNGVNYNDNLVINYTNGKIIFKNPVPLNEIITANFEFDVPVRFDNDTLEISMKNINSGEINNIRLIEIME